ncbi:MAG: flavin reductase family protein [Candidatus Omnitrophota bacterium]
MAKRELPPREALYPVPVVLVSCSDKDARRTNIITIAWCGVISSDPPLLSVSIRPSRHSHRLITETKDFVINIPTAAMLKKVDHCGLVSGKETDKFAECSFTPLNSKKTVSRAIEECPVNIECRLKRSVSLGAHDMFIGEVVLVRVDESILGKDGAIDYKKADPIVYNQGEYWNLGNNIGRYGCSLK